MTQIALFSSRGIAQLEEEVNEWLRKNNSHIRVIDIKHQIAECYDPEATMGTSRSMTAMILYETTE